MKIITGKSVSRRTLLRGLGATVALPFLDAMVPASVFGRSAAKRPNRFQTIYVPNGMAMEYWTPKGEGTDFELSPILEPLAPFRDRMQVLSGLYANWNQIHAGASGSFLTGIAEGGKDETDVFADISMDQLLGRQLGRDTQLASLELSMDAPANAGGLLEQSELCLHAHTFLGWSPSAATHGIQPAGGI